jgi:hypothetical protein
MDFTGTFLGALTIPMVMLNLLSIVSAFWLLLRGQWAVVVAGILAILGGLVIAPLLVRLAGWIADAAYAAFGEGHTKLAYRLATLGSACIVLTIVGWEVAILLYGHRRFGNDPAVWLWSYAIATGVWTWLAHLAQREQATIAALRAYAAQVAYMMLLIMVAWLHWPLAPALIPVIIPMLLPFVVGLLLAVADRDALRTVQI